MIKVYEVGRKYIMLFMHWFAYFVAVNYIACTYSPSSGKIFR